MDPRPFSTMEPTVIMPSSRRKRTGAKASKLLEIQINPNCILLMW